VSAVWRVVLSAVPTYLKLTGDWSLYLTLNCVLSHSLYAAFFVVFVIIHALHHIVFYVMRRTLGEFLSTNTVLCEMWNTGLFIFILYGCETWSLTLREKNIHRKKLPRRNLDVKESNKRTEKITHSGALPNSLLMV
jgi:hypothetical protein